MAGLQLAVLVTLFYCCIGASINKQLNQPLIWAPRTLCSKSDCEPETLAIRRYSGLTELVSVDSNQLVNSKSKLRDLPIEELVKFYLYTNQNSDSYQQLIVGDLNNLKQSNFNPQNPTKVIIHGYQNNIDSEVIQILKDGFLQIGTFNVIGVDWSDITTTLLYNVAAEETKKTGMFLGQLIDYLVSNGARIQDFHLLGHSLGAHVAGFAGKSVTSGRIPRISGMDPAKPAFYVEDPENRLNATDADFVDCIHTCGNFLGLLEHICMADYYPNGGEMTQPGCSWLEDIVGSCSHGMSFKFYAESITDTTNIFRTIECPDIPSTDPVNCKDSDAVMGYYASPKDLGIYYLRTNADLPYAQN